MELCKELPSKRDVSRPQSTLHQTFSLSISASNYSIAALIQLLVPTSAELGTFPPSLTRCPQDVQPTSSSIGSWYVDLFSDT
jgi:hypothetical protein